jgi:hypothetical protein
MWNWDNGEAVMPQGQNAVRHRIQLALPVPLFRSPIARSA